MEISEVFGFLIIINESIKLLPKNGKFMASITILSLVLPSILVLLLCYFYQSLTNNIMKSFRPDPGYISSQQMLIHLGVLLVAIATFVFACLVISHLSGIATILVSALSYTGKKLSLQDLFSRIKRPFRRQLKVSFRVSKNPTRYALVALILAAYLAIFDPNPITNSIAIVLGISVFIFQLYSSVVSVLSYVVLVVEESCEGREALEKAEQLVKDQRHHGFMLNLFFNLLLMIVFVGYWMILGDEGFLNLTTFGLFLMNSVSLMKTFGCMLYTVFYFHCKKHHGEEIDVLGNFQYAKLGNDI